MVEPTMWGEVRQYFAEAKKRRERNRWSVEKRRSWMFFVVGLTTLLVIMIGIFLLAVGVSGWFYLLFIPYPYLSWRVITFIMWYDDKYDL